MSPAAAASSWKNIHRLWVCITHFGIPVVPGGRVHEEQVVGAERAVGQVELGVVGRGDAVDERIAVALRGDDDVMGERQAVGAQVGDQLGRRPVAVVGEAHAARRRA